MYPRKERKLWGGSEVLVTEDKSIGADIYNLAETGDVAACVTAGGMTNAEGSGPRVIQVTDKTGPLVASGYAKNGTQEAMNGMNVVEPEYIVRRLTPTECERLQGYPSFLEFDVARMNDDEYAACCEVFGKIDDKQTILDYSAGGYIRALCGRGIGIARVLQIVHERGWTDIGEWTDAKGKKHKPADAPRYKAIGNSIAVSCWRFIVQGISAQYDHPITMASLFDGIGGFPLVWEEVNGKGSALWASEIEEFPIAVTKIRFPEEE